MVMEPFLKHIQKKQLFKLKMQMSQFNSRNKSFKYVYTNLDMFCQYSQIFVYYLKKIFWL